ncbi:MAG: aldose 1-epimerase family protein [Gemmatales bacterium]|nr:aldose 1-epimerase family protein [Gemmatales bacterium]MDW8222366.1 aldose 1-epimerase family protein [Gemmatales bacterium]
MAKTQRWLLTDVSADLWTERFHVSSGDRADVAFPHSWFISKRTLRGGKRDGVELLEVHNGVLTLSVLPTRGMGLWRGEYRGWRLGWQAPVRGPVHPQWVQLLDRGGLGWLDGFDEWICRCGLHSNGPPGHDPQPNEFLPLHGRIANQPAHYLAVEVQSEPPFLLSVTGRVQESTLFFSHLELRSTFRTPLGANWFEIEDEIINLSTKSAELELLYHCNFGPPFLENGSRVVAPIRELAPRNARAAEGIDNWDKYLGPTPGFVEQVYFADLATNAVGMTLALLHNAAQDKGVVLRWLKAQLPHFIVWKNTAAVEDGYVTGLEPATNLPNFKAFEREQGRVISLPPHGQYRAVLRIEVLDRRESVQAVLGEIAQLTPTPAVVHRQPHPTWCQPAS